MQKPRMLIIAVACSAALAGCAGDNWFSRTFGKGSNGDSTASASKDSTARSETSKPDKQAAYDSKTTNASAPADTASTASGSVSASAPNVATTGGATISSTTSPSTASSANADPAAAGTSAIGTTTLSGASTGLSSSSSKTTPDTTTSSTKSTTGTSAKLAAADKKFFNDAAQAGMLEIEASKLAQDRATKADVKSFASMIVNDHTGADAQLKSLAADKGVTLPTALTGKHKQTLDKLQKAQGAEFDKVYAATVGVAAHKEAVSLFDKTAKNAKDPDVKSFAAKTLPTLKQHLAQAQTLAKGSNGASGRDTGGPPPSSKPTMSDTLNPANTKTDAQKASTSKDSPVMGRESTTAPYPPTQPATK